MKQKFFNSILILALLGSATLFASEATLKERVTRKINKTFSVNTNALLEVDNMYGNLNITSWEKNTIEITVEIIIEGKSLSRIEDKMEEIEISFSSSPEKVVAKTEINKSWVRGFHTDKPKIEINYTIKMPINGAVDLSNDYGAILLDQLNGKAIISCDYGKMIIGELNAENNELSFDYTNNSTIEYIRSGKINADYSSFEVGEAENIVLNSDYSKVSFENITDLNFTMDYGKLYLNEVETVKGSGDYTSIHVGTLAKAININAEYGSFRVNEVLKSFEKIDLNLEFVNAQIGLNSENSFTFELDLEFCSFSSQLPLDYNQKIKDFSEKYYSGSYNNNGDTAGSITVAAEFGSLKFK